MQTNKSNKRKKSKKTKEDKIPAVESVVRVMSKKKGMGQLLIGFRTLCLVVTASTGWKKTYRSNL